MRFFGVFLLVFLFSGTAGAQVVERGDSRAQAQQRAQQTQPLNNAPVWRDIREGRPGTIATQGQEYGVAIMDAGETWRQFRNGPLTIFGGWLILLVPLAILAYYFAKGQMKLHEPLTGRELQRFTVLERAVHWTAAASFVILALSGLTLLFGKHVMMPLTGQLAFSWWSAASKALHNTFGPIFVVSLLLMIPLYMKDNFWKPHDWKWVRHMGGFVDKHDVPSGKYNAGEKGWYWIGVVACGILVSLSGLVLLFPNLVPQREMMQIAHVVHAIASVGFVCLGFGHIYLGTIGMQGAYAAMRKGTVDETWAKEHHLYWYREKKAAAPGASHGGAAAARQPAQRHED